MHVCWHKFARYWDVEERLVSVEAGRCIANSEEIVKRCDENSIGVVATLGSTVTGEYEPVREIADALDEFQTETGLDVPIPVDGASGDMVAPFVQPALEWDFSVERVASINASGHKCGLAPLGVGWIVATSEEFLPAELICNVNYLGGETPALAISFSSRGRLPILV